MNIWGIVGACSVLLLAGIWIYERLPRWRAQAARDGREPSTEDQFGERFFTPDLSQIAARLRRIAGEELGKDLSRLHPDDSLVETLFDGFDSLDSVEVLMAIEDEFGIELDDAAITDCVTFRDFVEAVAARRPFLVKWRQKMGRGTEEKLGVRLSREVLVKLATPIELADAVAAELKNQVGGQNSCQSQRAFYLLRSAMMRTWHAPRSLITPATSLANLTHWRTAGSEWSQLRDAVGAQQWPPLVRPRWMSWLVYGLPLLTGAVVGVGLPSFADWAFLHSNTLGFLLSFAAGVRGLFVIPLVIFSWVLLVGISALFNRSLPGRIRSVGDLVPFVITSAEMTWTREQIEEQVRQIVVGPLQVAMERYRAEGRFVEEFGLENDIEKS